MQHRSSQRGFTLVELSIVLVIIGLIVGGVLVGQALIAAAKVRAQLTQLDQVDAALNTFRARFECLPGDCTAASGLTTVASGAGTSTGDGRITYTETWTATTESGIAWVQMASQGMVNGTFTPDATYSAAQISSAKLGGHIMLGSDTSYNYFAIGNFTTVVGANAGGLAADAALAIDTKRDNGIPGEGNVIAVADDAAGPFGATFVAAGAAVTDCRTAAADPGVYNVTSPTAGCLLRVRTSG